jgi:tetrahydromethanopterin S-methyltransferase subunit B
MVITLYRPPHQAMDRDNAYASVQPVVNSVKKLGHLVDDSEQWLDLQVVQVDFKGRKTEVEIEDLGIYMGG